MNIHPSALLRAAEQAAFESGATTPDALMDAAIAACCALLEQDAAFAGAARRYRRAIVYAGKGNNAGDAIGLARCLGFADIHLRCAAPLHTMSAETRRQLAAIPPERQHVEPATPAIDGPALLIDGLLGSGARGSLRPEYAQLVEELNTLRRTHPRSLTLALDIPTGLAPDTPALPRCAVRADATLAIGCVKPGMLADGAEDYVGRLLCVPLPPSCIQLPESPAQALGEDTLTWLPQRAYSHYKNRAGRVRVIAGSPGYTGAAQMCAEAALAAGAGLIELYCLPGEHAILAARVAAEIMVRPVTSYAEVPAEGADALLIGPGLGQPSVENRRALQALVESTTCPLVLDADGLNLAAAHRWALPRTAILTPHPGEMRRLFPAAAELTRAAAAASFVGSTPCTLLLKGARSIITDGERFYYNTTGGPWMANGGQGDVLSGAVAALAAQGLPPVRAAALGAWLCGRAATCAWAAAGFPLAVRATQLLPHLTRLYCTKSLGIGRSSGAFEAGITGGAE